MSKEKLRLVKSALNDTVYAGTLNKKRDAFLSDKTDVTSDFNKAIIDVYSGYSAVLGHEGNYHKITVTPITDEQAREEFERVRNKIKE
jgi:cyclopropane fatty-acyl-phospholipid synthase-like methyltransferase